MSYRVFTRNWWKANPTWPNGREPDTNAERTYIARVATEDQARRICMEYNRENNPGFLSNKAEYEEV